MAYKVAIAEDADMAELIAVLWDGFERPYQGILRNFFPILNNDREASLLAAIEGQREEYKVSYPELVWLKVTYHADDGDTQGTIVGGAKWYFYERNPFVPKPGSDHDPNAEVAFWYPEGPGRTFATATMYAIVEPRATMVQGPHAFLNIAFTVLEHRRKGVANLFLKWGLNRADELDLGTWLDASEFGQPVYEKLGFHSHLLNKISPVMPASYTADEKAEWEKLEKEILPVYAMMMWRPVGGKFIEGETVLPWDH